MSTNKDRWLGGAILLSGGLLGGVFLLQGDGKHALTNPTNTPASQLSQPATSGDAANPFATGADGQTTDSTTGDDNSAVHLRPLTLDVETEQRMLEAQHAARAKQVAEQEARTAEFLARQQAAESDAARRAAEEQAARLAARQAREDATLTSTDPAAPEMAQDPVEDAHRLEAQKRTEERTTQTTQARAQAAEATVARDRAQQAADAARDRADQARQERLVLEKQQADQERERIQAEVARKADDKRKAEDQRKADEAAKVRAEKDARLQAEAEAKAKIKAEKDARLQAEADAKSKAKADKAARLQADADAKAQAKLDKAERQKAEQAAQKSAQEARDAESVRLLAEQKAKDSAAKRKLQVDTQQDLAQAAQLRQRAEKARREAEQLAAELKKLEDKQSASQVKKPASDSINADLRKQQDAARARAIMGADDAPQQPWMVQVAMATDQAGADAMVSKLRAKGYKVRTSLTTKGVRVLVGPEKTKDSATALQQKIHQDPSLNIKGAWVSNWQPLTP
jgi:hypothetical protein